MLPFFPPSLAPRAVAVLGSWKSVALTPFVLRVLRRRRRRLFFAKFPLTPECDAAQVLHALRALLVCAEVGHAVVGKDPNEFGGSLPTGLAFMLGKVVQSGESKAGKLPWEGGTGNLVSC